MCRSQFVSFFILRIVLFGWLLFRNTYLLSDQLMTLPVSTLAVVLFGFFVGYPMQWLWFQKIVQGLMKVLRGKPTKGKKA